MSTPTRAAKLREIEAIIADNARLLGEKPKLRVRFYPKRGWPGWVRIYDVRDDGTVNRKNYREYAGVDRALEFAHESNRRAQRVHELMLAGSSLLDAVREVTAND